MVQNTNTTIEKQQQQQQETTQNNDAHHHKASEYELSREERIKENRERMQKLGIVDLSLKLNAFKNPTPKRAYQRKLSQNDSPLPLAGPTRRSSRLQNSTPVSYCEVPAGKKEKSMNDDDILREEGSKPEVYTDEHEKLLGSTEKSWTLFVDGYGKDGRRIYDPVNGKTCHQCRQKTLGHRTHCSTCNLVQGQFCGDCLYMRYGENVLEANQNPDWICPVCRGICNCSLCRHAKGWPATGALYRKISSLGYKSVAHYLIQTRRLNATTDSDENVGTHVPVSAKRSLPFSDIEVTKENDDISAKRSLPFRDIEVTKENDDLSNSSRECLNTDPLSEIDNKLGNSKTESKTVSESSDSQLKDQVEYSIKPEHEKIGAEYHTNNDSKGLISENLEGGDDNEIKKEEILVLDKKDFVLPEKSPKSTKKRVRSGSIPADCIASRLKMRRRVR